MPPLSNVACPGSDNQDFGMRSGLPSEDQRGPTQIYPAQWPPGEKPKPCQCKMKHHGNARMRYVQPERQASYKPQSMFKQPEYKIESGTIYKLSYPGVDQETLLQSRSERVQRVADSIKPSSLPFEQNTTFRLSYTGVGGERAAPYTPAYRSMMGSGPMQSVTTQRHDFTPKPTEKTQSLKPATNMNFSSCKMEGITTMSASYQPVEAEKVESYKPKAVFQNSDNKFEHDTINKLSYQPWEPMPKEEFPWAKRPKFQQPQKPMDCATIYRASYLNTEGCERAEPYKPKYGANTISDFRPFAQNTVYRDSYQNVSEGFSRQEPIKAQTQILPSSLPMSQDTTFRLSYTGVGGEKAAMYKPMYRNMMGSGPMQVVTTQRHDFTPKPLVQSENFKPKPTMINANQKMEDTTTFRASYQPNDKFEKVESYKPRSMFRKSDYAFESNTVNKLSYQPWEPQPKEEFPWAKRPKYQQPTSTIDGTSIYRGSYVSPGNYVADENAPPIEEEGPCLCMYRGQCLATDGI